MSGWLSARANVESSKSFNRQRNSCLDSVVEDSKSQNLNRSVIGAAWPRECQFFGERARRSLVAIFTKSASESAFIFRIT